MQTSTATVSSPFAPKPNRFPGACSVCQTHVRRDAGVVVVAAKGDSRLFCLRDRSAADDLAAHLSAKSAPPSRSTPPSNTTPPARNPAGSGRTPPPASRTALQAVDALLSVAARDDDAARVAAIHEIAACVRWCAAQTIAAEPEEHDSATIASDLLASIGITPSGGARSTDTAGSIHDGVTTFFAPDTTPSKASARRTKGAAAKPSKSTAPASTGDRWAALRKGSA